MKKWTPPASKRCGTSDRIRYYEQHHSLVLDPYRCAIWSCSRPFLRRRPVAVSGPTTLIAALDATVTGMGARLLRSWAVRPLIEREAIEARLGAVAHLVQQTVVRGELRKELKGIQDLERLTSRNHPGPGDSARTCGAS